MTCHEFQELLQRRMDGEGSADSVELAAHLSACAECQALQGAARRFEAGMRRLRQPMPSADLTNRIVRQVLGYRRAARRSSLVRAATALAAVIVFALLVGMWANQRNNNEPTLQQNSFVQEQPEQATEPVATVGPSLRESMTGVAQLTIRSADETMRNLLPGTPANADGPSPLSSSVASLREAGNNVTTGLEPVADSAKRALDLFLREIPPVRAEDKRGS
jgi:hypothetical protein